VISVGPTFHIICVVQLANFSRKWLYQYRILEICWFDLQCTEEVYSQHRYLRAASDQNAS